MPNRCVPVSPGAELRVVRMGTGTHGLGRRASIVLAVAMALTFAGQQALAVQVAPGGAGTFRATANAPAPTTKALPELAGSSDLSAAGLARQAQALGVGRGSDKADSRVVSIVNAASAHGGEAALTRARQNGLQVAGASVRVIVEASDVAKARASAALAGATVEGTAGNLVQVLVAPGRLASLINGAGVAYIRPPMIHTEDAVTDEAVASTNASTWQGAGVGGAGVKVAVIDDGFIGYTSAQATGDLPASLTTVDDCGGQFNSASAHGTAVAEIVYKMAPQAQLYLICISTEVDLANAEAYAKSNGIQIINHSISWYNTSRGDGLGAPGTPDATVADAQWNGILWVNSAGNDAQDHWTGGFVDNGHGLQEFAPWTDGDGFAIGTDETQCVALKWDSWPVTAQDFDLYVVNSNGTVLAASENVQDGTEPPVESTCYTNSGAPTVLYVVIANYSASQSPRFDLFLPGAGQIQFSVATGSVSEPASSPYAFSVGAVCWAGNTVEPYSSEGPTIDGRMAPDISGPDQVSTSIYGNFAGCGAYAGFAGTSASAPHVVGAAALVKSANPAFSVAQLESYLMAGATDLGPVGGDNVTGAGMIHLKVWPTSAGIFDVSGYFTGDATGATYHPLTPVRILDTRTNLGIAGALPSHVAKTLHVTGVGGVPADAIAVSGNLTVTAQTSLGFLYLGPNAMNNPTSSTLNFPVGDDRANAVTVPLAGDGSLSVTYAAPTLAASAQVIFDVSGYFTAAATGATYHPLTPTRILDTRSNLGITGALANRVAETFQVTGFGGVPAGAIAVTGNLTVTQQTALGYLYLGPDATNNPTSSTLNFPVGDDRANSVAVPLAADGSLSVTYASSYSGAKAHVIFDVSGYYTADTTGATYHPLTPTRILDTRSNVGLSGKLVTRVARTFQVSGAGGVPSGALAVTGNLTVTQQTGLGFMYLGPAAANNPTSSTLNFPVGDDRANAVIVPLAVDGSLSITYAAPFSAATPT